MRWCITAQIKGDAENLQKKEHYGRISTFSEKGGIFFPCQRKQTFRIRIQNLNFRDYTLQKRSSLSHAHKNCVVRRAIPFRIFLYNSHHLIWRCCTSLGFLGLQSWVWKMRFLFQQTFVAKIIVCEVSPIWNSLFRFLDRNETESSSPSTEF